MSRLPGRFQWAILFIWIICGNTAGSFAQQDQRGSPSVLMEKPSLGPLPGTFGPSLGSGPGAMEPSEFAPGGAGIIGGRARGGSGKVSRKPSKGSGRPTVTSMPIPGGDFTPEPMVAKLPAGAAMNFADDEGDPQGLTLDAAIDRMLLANLDLLALRHEIPQADADILTAGLRSNPLLYGDSQFIPYGKNWSNARPGGPTQYDFNVTYPMDVSGKRLARVRVARLAKSGVEAQYQDAVRRQIGTLYHAFVELQVARLNAIGSEVTVREQERIVTDATRREAHGGPAINNAERLSIELEQLRTARDDTRDALEDAKEAVSLLLNLPPEETNRLQPRGKLRVPAPVLPPLEGLTQVAMTARPDLISIRRGVGRAEAELALARTNRFEDIFLFYDPITYQDNRPSKAPSARSWDMGVTIPLPLFNRNQGNIARAHGNISQTQVELSAIQRRIVSEVRLAEREFRNARDALPRIENSTLPRARKARTDAAKDFAAGKSGVDDYLGHLNDESETSRNYRDALVRYRRSMLDLNTALGVRILP